MRFLPLLVTLALPLAARADAPKYEIKDNHLVLPAPIVFETNSAKLAPASDATIAFIKGYLDDKSYISLMRIENHSDAQGDAKANQALSEKRALAVAKAIVAKGIDCKRLIAVGFGSTKPVAPDDTPENRAKNRRTEAANAALRGHAIGGMPADGGGQVAGDTCAK